MKVLFPVIVALAVVGCATASSPTAKSANSIRGAFPLLVTPWTAEAELDVEVLVKEAGFVNDCGVGGVIWPTAGEVIGTLSDDEYERGLDALAARAAKPDFTARLTAICPGKTSDAALARVQLVNRLQKKHNVKMAILARPPDDATNETAIVAHYRALGKIAECPVIIQTFNGKSPQQSIASIIALAKEFPDVYGYVKEESPGLKVNDRIAQLVAAQPAIKTVFSGWGAKGFLYQGPRLGTRGIITQRPAYADLLAYIFKRVDEGDDGTLVDAYSKLLLMYNLGDVFDNSDDTMRGPHLYVLEKRGVFKNRFTRVKAPKGSAKKWTVKDFPLTNLQKAEIDMRLEAIKPYLKK